MPRSRCYSDLLRLPTFIDRFHYLRIKGTVGDSTFGFDRYLNQQFYHSYEWGCIRDQVIARDNGCDLGIADRPISGRIYVHHMNPISIDDVYKASDWLLNPEYLICTSFETHTAIHYGSEDLLYLDPIERRPNDMCPWKK